MNNTFERIFTHILGSIVGAAIGLTLKSMSTAFAETYMSQLILALCVVIGLIVSIAITETKAELTLRKNNKIRDETVALITHEMRTGLTSTGWAIDLVLKKYDAAISADDKQLLSDVMKSIKTTVMHSVNLLDISLLDIGKLAISLSWAKLDAVETMFKETLEKYTLGAKKHDIELTDTIELDTAREVEVDMMRLRIILENLLENAIQYTKGDIRKIHVEIKNDMKNMNITVKDTGIGIPETEKAKIFSEFYRASNARKMLASGSGIGLYTCAQYVKAHHGTIRFESSENQGTTFFITIPLKTIADVHDFLNKV